MKVQILTKYFKNAVSALEQLIKYGELKIDPKTGIIASLMDEALTTWIQIKIPVTSPSLTVDNLENTIKNTSTHLQRALKLSFSTEVLQTQDINENKFIFPISLTIKSQLFKNVIKDLQIIDSDALFGKANETNDETNKIDVDNDETDEMVDSDDSDDLDESVEIVERFYTDNSDLD